MLARIRGFFARRNVLEVETPILSPAAATDPNLQSFATCYTGPGKPDGCTFYLQTSPEFPMKRLLAIGSGSIYQICKAFRNGEAGCLHNPEFTLLEWYRVGFDHHQIMDETAELVTEALKERFRLGPVEKLSYRDAFLRYCDLDPHTTGVDGFAACAREQGIRVDDLSRDALDPWRDLLLTHVIQPHMGKGQLTFLYDYPASQAALARVRRGQTPVAERFELYLEGIELANGFHELDDAREQHRRFERDLATRKHFGLPSVPSDGPLLAALEHGLPACAGVALGVDRLVMLATGGGSLAEVMAFPIDRV